MLGFMAKQRLRPTGGRENRGLANGTARASPSNYGERKRGGWRPDMDMNTLDAGQHEPEKSSGAAPELQNKIKDTIFSSNNFVSFFPNLP